MSPHAIRQEPCRTCGACCRDAAGAKFVTGEEARAIARLDRVGFIVRNPDHGFLTFKDKDWACVFYDAAASRCAIYEKRPFDCRIFPYDILRDGDGYIWIKWTLDLCALHSMLDDDPELQSLERTALPSFVDSLPEYARYTTSLLARHPDRRYTVLRPVRIPEARGARRGGVPSGRVPGGGQNRGSGAAGG